MLGAFRVRSFRFQWPADLITSWAFEMETLILSWYVIVNTGSVLLLTTFASLQFVGTLASPMFGVLGDRVGARAMLCAMRASYIVMAVVVMVLALAGLLTPAWVLVIAAVGGVVRPNDQVMRNALVGESMPPEFLMGALGLSRASMDSARMAGALAGAGLSSVLGTGHAYIAVTLFYVASLALTFGVARWRPVPDPGAGPRGSVSRPSRYGDLKDGLRYVASTPALLAVMLLAFMINLCAYPVTSGLLAYVARGIYVVDATGLGWLVASFACGALVGSITLVAMGGPRHPQRTVLVNTALWYGLLLAFGYTQTMALGLVLLLLAGFVQSLAMVPMSGVLLAATEPRFRTRVMGVRMLAVYGMPLGLLGSGVLIERVGFALTVTVCCAIGLVFTVLIAVKWRASMWPRRALAPQRVA